MFTLTFTKTRPNTKFYWEDGVGNKSFNELISEAKRILGARVQTSSSNHTTVWVIKEVTEESLNHYLTSKKDTVENLVRHSVINGIDISAPDFMYQNFSI